MNKIEIEIENEIVTFKPFFYKSGKIGLMMKSENESSRFNGNATLNTDNNLSKNEIIVKSYDNNRGVYEALLKADLIHSYKAITHIGYKKAQVCQITDKLKRLVYI